MLVGAQARSVYARALANEAYKQECGECQYVGEGVLRLIYPLKSFVCDFSFLLTVVTDTSIPYSNVRCSM